MHAWPFQSCFWHIHMFRLCMSLHFLASMPVPKCCVRVLSTIHKRIMPDYQTLITMQVLIISPLTSIYHSHCMGVSPPLGHPKSTVTDPHPIFEIMFVHVTAIMLSIGGYARVLRHFVWVFSLLADNARQDVLRFSTVVYCSTAPMLS